MSRGRLCIISRTSRRLCCYYFVKAAFIKKQFTALFVLGDLRDRCWASSADTKQLGVGIKASFSENVDSASHQPEKKRLTLLGKDKASSQSCQKNVKMFA